MNVDLRKGSIATITVLSAVGLWWLAAAPAPAVPGDPAGPLDSPVTPHTSPVVAAERRRLPAAMPVGRYGAAVGTEMTFGFTAESTSTLRGATDSAPASMRFSLAGQAVVTVVARRPGELLVEFRFPDTTIAIEGGSPGSAGSAPLAADLARPAFVAMGEDGSMRGLRFDPLVQVESHNWLRGLVTALRFVGRGDQESWRVDEADASGVADVEYRWVERGDEAAPSVLSRRKLGYRAVADGAGVGIDPLGANGPRLGGQASASFDPCLGWYFAVQVDESLELPIPDSSATLAATWRGSFELRSIGERRPLPPVAFDGEWAPLDGRATSQAMSEKAAAARLEAELANTSVAMALQELVAAASTDAGIGGELERLAQLLRHRPEALAELAALLAGRTPDRGLELALVAIADAGTPAAQALLVAMLGDVGNAPALGMSVVRAMFAIAAPEATVVAKLSAMARGDADQAIAAGCLLALGCAAGRVDASQQASVLGELVAMRPAPGQEAANWLEALGNAGLAGNPAAIEPFVRSAESAVRASSLVALRRVADPAAVALLSALAAEDPAPVVRTRALEVLAERGDGGTVALFERAVAHESDPDAVVAAIRGLAAMATEPAAQRALQRIIQEHADADVREMARQALRRA